MDEGLSLEGRSMHASKTAPGGVVNADTIFRFQQTDNLVTAEYAGGGIRRGSLVGLLSNGTLHFRYAQLQDDGRLDGGESHCEVKMDASGRVSIIEHYAWASRPGAGTNVISELPESRSQAPPASQEGDPASRRAV